MPKITYISHNGERNILDVRSGLTVMEGAVKNGLPGIDADCGGALQCATCHVYVDAAWLDRLSAPSEDETAMLEGAIEVRPNSRLSCQLKVSDELDGLIVTTPASQR